MAGTRERLAAASGRKRELVGLLQEVVEHVLDGDVQLDVVLRIADLAQNELADLDLAEKFYAKALDLRGDERRALVALEALHEQRGEHEALLSVLRRHVDAAESTEERKALMFRQAKLCSETLGDTNSAILVYEAILDIDMDGAAASSLEALYERAKKPHELIVLYERLLSEGRNPADLHVKIALTRHIELTMLHCFDELNAALGCRCPARWGDRRASAMPDGESTRTRGSCREINQYGAAVTPYTDSRACNTSEGADRIELLRRLASVSAIRATLETTRKLLRGADEGRRELAFWPTRRRCRRGFPFVNVVALPRDFANAPVNSLPKWGTWTMP
jgi:tetratricopeptide (TPR) repeat protein